MRRALLVLVLFPTALLAMMGCSREVRHENTHPGVGVFHEPLHVVASSASPGLVGVVDSSGIVVAPFKYDAAKITGNYIIVREKGLVGLLSADGRELLPCTHKYVSAQGWTITSNSPSPGTWEGAGRFIVTDGIAYDSALRRVTPEGTIFKEAVLGDCQVVIDSTTGRLRVVKPDGSLFTEAEPLYRFVVVRRDSLVALSKEGVFSLYGPGLIQVGDAKFGDIAGYNDDLIVVSSDGRFGFLDYHGKMVLPPVYEQVGGFSEGLCAVRARLKADGSIDMSPPVPDVEGQPPKTLWGYIRRDGSFAIPPSFYSAHCFHDGIAHVTLTNSVGSHYVEDLYVDVTGKRIPKAPDASWFDGLKGLGISKNPPPRD